MLRNINSTRKYLNLGLKSMINIEEQHLGKINHPFLGLFQDYIMAGVQSNTNPGKPQLTPE